MYQVLQQIKTKICESIEFYNKLKAIALQNNVIFLMQKATTHDAINIANCTL